MEDQPVPYNPSSHQGSIPRSRPVTLDHVGPQQKYRPPRGKDLKRKLLRRTRKSIAGRFYQLLSRHARYWTVSEADSGVDEDELDSP